MDAGYIDLQKITETIVEGVRPRSVYLFGSHARGTARADSDYDFLIVVDQLPRSRFEEINRIRKLLAQFDIAKDILLFSEAEFSEWRGSLNHVVGRAVREGKLLYARH